MSTCVFPVYLSEFSMAKTCHLFHRTLSKKGHNMSHTYKTNPSFASMFSFFHLPLPNGKTTPQFESHPLLTACSFPKQLCPHSSYFHCKALLLAF